MMRYSRLMLYMRRALRMGLSLWLWDGFALSSLIMTSRVIDREAGGVTETPEINEDARSPRWLPLGSPQLIFVMWKMHEEERINGKAKVKLKAEVGMSRSSCVFSLTWVKCSSNACVYICDSCDAQPLILIFALPRRRTVIFQRWKRPIEKFAPHETRNPETAARFFIWTATSSLAFRILLSEGSTRQWRRAIILVRRSAQVTTVECRELQSGSHVKTTKGDSQQFIVGRAAGTTALWDKLLLDLCRVCRKRRPFLPFLLRACATLFPWQSRSKCSTKYYVDVPKSINLYWLSCDYSDKICISCIYINKYRESFSLENFSKFCIIAFDETNRKSWGRKHLLPN